MRQRVIRTDGNAQAAGTALLSGSHQLAPILPFRFRFEKDERLAADESAAELPERHESDSAPNDNSRSFRPRANPSLRFKPLWSWYQYQSSTAGSS